MESKDGITEVVFQALRWLVSIEADLTRANTSTLLQAYLSFIVCRDLVPDLSAEIVPQLKALYITFKNKSVDELAQCDSGAVLLCCIAQLRLEGELLPTFKSYVDEVINILTQVQGNIATTSHYRVQILLHHLGFLPPPAQPSFAWPKDLFSILTGNSEQIRSVSEQIMAQTNYGAQSIECPVDLVPVLQAGALHSLRVYDLDLGGSLLRSLAYLGERDSFIMRTARDFIIDNQCVDGSFGFFDREITSLRSEHTHYNSLSLQVPALLVCLWTIAETGIQPYSLHHHLTQMKAAR